MNEKISIMIGGSMTFASKMKEAKKVLEKFGFDVNVPLDTYHVIKEPEKKCDIKFMKKLGVGRGDAELVAKSDAFLVLNYEKNSIKGYIGSGAYRDICIAWWLKKKIFFLFPYDETQNNHKYEMLGFAPIILDGKIENINSYLL
ncbi:hypothetical protein COY26_05625 [Candidatus Woesearchaeota archaeon CG_4_10_14_0_2_um_filter_33_10]|nr:MAG: hypothetical protein AUJ83_02500 [Candidatus Woesearchaeota archaeon CG1_02_33_12]PIN78481.1 MAG: hypothetical protein COV14_03575 [Candidatus Woesearchaeota archaeon CG10_big_fil_rev_8_21_14_0_10_33_12]PIU72792.1 MAG: hypothetical protein COS79_01070 [Candidatus Woesearchaeota archaeon CG06_land_8_20_14_3_00_33_13]PIZ51784.1 MAG: hypothetical protein COY26_05625 [Candidatus Woesearchaeota archaeon CG_4_10_14_0_2_um_filter_33_10]